MKSTYLRKAEDEVEEAGKDHVVSYCRKYVEVARVHELEQKLLKLGMQMRKALLG